MTWGLSFAIGIFVDTRLFLHLWVRLSTAETPRRRQSLPGFERVLHR